MRLPKNAPKFFPGLFVARREPKTGYTFYGENIMVAREDTEVASSISPDVIRQSVFNETGRPPTMKEAGVPLALHLNIGGIQGVMNDTFLAGKVIPEWQSFRRNGLGGQLPFTERQIIDRGEASPYGGRVTVQGGSGNDVTPGVVSVNGLTYYPGEGY